MDSKEFKDVFSHIAKANGFEKAFGGWFRESSECITVLDLQKSNFGDYYQLNIKIFVQGIFGRTYTRNKDLVKKDVGHIRNGEPEEYKEIFDFNVPMEDSKRKERLERLFSEFVVPFTKKALSKSGIEMLADEGSLFLLPAVKEELRG